MPETVAAQSGNSLPLTDIILQTTRLSPKQMAEAAFTEYWDGFNRQHTVPEDTRQGFIDAHMDKVDPTKVKPRSQYATGVTMYDNYVAQFTWEILWKDRARQGGN